MTFGRHKQDFLKTILWIKSPALVRVCRWCVFAMPLSDLYAHLPGLRDSPPTTLDRILGAFDSDVGSGSTVEKKQNLSSSLALFASLRSGRGIVA